MNRIVPGEGLFDRPDVVLFPPRPHRRIVRFMQRNRALRFCALTLATAALVACEDEVTNPEDQFIE
jgi:hypothetical protein